MESNGINADSLENYEAIKYTLSQAKTDYTGLYKIWFVYGFLRLILTILNYSYSPISSEPALVYFMLILDGLIIPVLLILFYIKLFHKERKITNKYYLSCVALWGIPVVAIPIFSFLIRLVQSIFSLPYYAMTAISTNLWSFEYIMNILLVCMCYIICAYILDKKWLIAVGLLMLLSFLVLNILGDCEVLVITWPEAYGATASLSAASIIHNIYIIAGYFAAAFAVRSSVKKRRGFAHEPR